jgi:hypothetical protein
MNKLDELFQTYIIEQKKGDYIRLKEKVKNNEDYWDALTVVEIISKNNNKITLKSLDGTTAVVDISKLKYEKI